MSLLTALTPRHASGAPVSAPAPVTGLSLTQSSNLTQVSGPPSATSLQALSPILLSLINTGIQGPPGATSNLYYEHSQPTSSATWTINHNLNARPNVRVYTAGGREVLADVLHVSLNQALVEFDQPQSGFAICS